VTKVEYEQEFEANKIAPSSDSPIEPPQQRLPRRFYHFIEDLSIRPNDSPMETDDQNFHNVSSGKTSSVAGLPTGASFGSNFNLAAAMSNLNHSTRSPESDSFSYMEMLLESLAVLGKLGSGLDVVAQRVPGEIFNLIEAVLDEVSERADYLRRGSIVGVPTELGMTSEDVYVVTGGTGPRNMGLTSIGVHAAVGPVNKGSGTFLSASGLRLAALEDSTKQIDHEILKDFFWTLYSKLDAVTQGFRVVSEVANRIGSVSLVCLQTF
jgi:exocyst complex component 4